MTSLSHFALTMRSAGRRTRALRRIMGRSEVEGLIDKVQDGYGEEWSWAAILFDVAELEYWRDSALWSEAWQGLYGFQGCGNHYQLVERQSQKPKSSYTWPWFDCCRVIIVRKQPGEGSTSPSSSLGMKSLHPRGCTPKDWSNYNRLICSSHLCSDTGAKKVKLSVSSRSVFNSPRIGGNSAIQLIPHSNILTLSMLPTY